MQEKKKINVGKVFKERQAKVKETPLIERLPTWGELDRAFKKRGQKLFGGGL